MSPDNLPPYLDINETARRVDSANLAGVLVDFPNQLTKTLIEFEKIVSSLDLSGFDQLVFCGMGGSAIGAELACDLPFDLKRKPLWIVRDYNLPAWVDKSTAVAVISYSGETAEVLSCFEQAKNRAGIVIVITSGGQLARLAVGAHLPLYQFDYQAPPRDALGYLFVPAVMLLERTGILNNQQADLSSAISLLQELKDIYGPNTPTAQNPAKQLAYQLYDHVPVVVGSGLTKSVARRWKNQFNEHAKTSCWFDELPEASHNTVEGFTFPSRFKDDAVVLFLESNFDHPDIIKRQSLWRNHLLQQGIQTVSLEAKGMDIWSNKLSLVYWGDWVSYYLALLYRVDPAPVLTIDKLKAQLGQH